MNETPPPSGFIFKKNVGSKLPSRQLEVLRAKLGMTPSFLTKFRKEDSGCWVWTGTRDKDGYGRIKYGKPIAAHRVSFLMHGGVLTPDKNFVLHSCHNPSCVNPDHLRAGNSQDNEDDKKRAGRQCRGQDMHTSKLTESDVIRIKTVFHKGGVTKQSLGDKFQVSRQTIYKIIYGLTWKHITI